MNDAEQRRRRAAPGAGPPTAGPPGGGTRVVIVDRRDFDRLALEVLCQHTPAVAVAASVASVPEAVRVLGGGSAVILIGRQMLRADGPDAVSRLRQAGAERVIVVGTNDQRGLRGEAMRVDADGFLERDADAAVQARALRGENGTVPRWDERPTS